MMNRQTKADMWSLLSVTIDDVIKKMDDVITYLVAT